MGKKGDKLDGFIAQLSHDTAACRQDDFRWSDYNVLICINTLRGIEKDEAKLAEKLTLLYNTYFDKGKALDLATI